jgi:PAS domain S-box-containing protein
MIATSRLGTGTTMSTIRRHAAADGPHPVDDQLAEEDARADERGLRLILDNVPALVNTMTPTGEIDFANRQLLDYLGVSLEQLQDWQPFIHESDRAMVSEAWAHAFADGRAFRAEYRLRRSDGVYRWVDGHTVPVRAQDGSIVRWCSLVVDIEERKQAEDLRRANERHAILDNIPGLVAIHKATGEPELFNRAAREYHGSCADDPKQWKITDVIHPDDLPWLLPARRRAVQTRQPFDTEPRMRRADGTYRYFLVRAVLVDDYDGTSRWYSVRTDIHDRKMAENALRQSEAFLLEVQRLSRTGGWRYDLATNVVESSPEIQRAYAPQPGEDISRPAFWFDRIHPEDRTRVQALFERCVRDKTEYRAGYRIVLPDGTIRYQHATGHPVTNDSGDLVQFIGASMDMTEHWLAANELERASQAVRDLQARMSRAAQVATVGELAGSIAHEVNQPLAAVVANGHACLRWLSVSPPNLPRAVEAAERIVKDGKDAGEVVRRVRALFKRTALEKVQLDLGEIIGEVLRLLDSYPARKPVLLDVVLDPDLPPVFADRVQLQQLVLNLMLNALEALETVSGRVKRLSVRSTCAGDQQVVIQISDNGIGLDDSVAAFEPFVTTKPEGMGLGLAICRSIVAAHEGSLSAQRNVGFGTTFTVTLPSQSQ